MPVAMDERWAVMLKLRYIFNISVQKQLTRVHLTISSKYKWMTIGAPTTPSGFGIDWSITTGDFKCFFFPPIYHWFTSGKLMTICSIPGIFYTYSTAVCTIPSKIKNQSSDRCSDPTKPIPSECITRNHHRVLWHIQYFLVCWKGCRPSFSIDSPAVFSRYCSIQLDHPITFPSTEGQLT